MPTESAKFLHVMLYLSERGGGGEKRSHKMLPTLLVVLSHGERSYRNYSNSDDCENNDFQNMAREGFPLPKNGILKCLKTTVLILLLFWTPLEMRAISSLTETMESSETKPLSLLKVGNKYCIYAGAIIST